MQRVIVIGGGVVGLASAWWLAEAGYRVSLLERCEHVGHGASFANGGQLSYRYVAPLADAGVPLKAWQWLLQKDGPLRLRLEADPRQWRWLVQFLRNCTATANRRTAATLLKLGELSKAAMASLDLPDPAGSFGWREAGKLVVYRSSAVFDVAAARIGAGTLVQVLSPGEAVALEPALAAMQPVLAGAIFTAGEAVADCHAFCLMLEQRLLQHPRFEGVLHGTARRLVVRNRRITAIETDGGQLQADQFVLAAGIQSRGLAATAGIRLPLYPLKGYSLTAPIRPLDRAPDISVTDFERKVLYARIGQQLRIAAMVDMVGEDTAIDPRRVAGLLRLAREAMPAAADYEQAIPWAGLRPATPNSAPLIGPSRYSNLWLNVGHGFTFACGSASVLADLMCGREAPFALEMLGTGRL
jgi:D-amino-acid dehydrogenase